MRAGFGIPWGNYSREGRKRKIEEILVKGFHGVYTGLDIARMLTSQVSLMSGDQLMRFGDLTGNNLAFSLGVKRRNGERLVAETHEIELEEDNDACDHEEDNLIKENTEG